MEQIYIFAYGSLMNPQSLAKALPGLRTTVRATLKWYQRKMNAPFGHYAYLNIVPNPSCDVAGVLIPLEKSEFEFFSSREEGYVKTDVTDAVSEPVQGRVFAFIAPDVGCNLKVPRSYLRTCTTGMSRDEREKWLAETI